MKLNRFTQWLLLTVVLCLIGAATIYLAPKQFEGSGDMVSFTVAAEDRLNIATEHTSFQAVSPEYFMLKHEESGELIEGNTQQPVPIGWEYGTYYVANNENVTPGLWHVERGSDIRTRLLHEQGLEATHFLSRAAWQMPVVAPVLIVMFYYWQDALSYSMCITV